MEQTEKTGFSEKQQNLVNCPTEPDIKATTGRGA